MRHVRPVLAGGAYFAVIFFIGFILGTLRVLWLRPIVGELPAVLLELPVMLTASWFAAAAIIRKFDIAPQRTPRLIMGIVALGMLMLAEAGLTMWLPSQAESQALADGPRIAGFAGQIIFALIPWLHMRRHTHIKNPQAAKPPAGFAVSKRL